MKTITRHAVSFTYTTNASAHTKGAWTQIVASTSGDCDLILVAVNVDASNTITSSLIDIGIGASGSETVVIGDLAVSSHGSVTMGIPLKVPAGSRVAIRGQTVRTGGITVNSFCHLIDTGFYDFAPTSVDVLGTSTATSEAVATVTNDTYVELVASTSKIYSTLIFIPSASSTNLPNATAIITGGVGASGSEIDVCSAPILLTSAESVRDVSHAWYRGSSGVYPAGIRIAAKTSTSAGNVDVCVIGIPY
jgi:hypothetical protein